MAMIHVPTIGSVTFGLHLAVIAVALLLGITRKGVQFSAGSRIWWRASTQVVAPTRALVRQLSSAVNKPVYLVYRLTEQVKSIKLRPN